MKHLFLKGNKRDSQKTLQFLNNLYVLKKGGNKKSVSSGVNTNLVKHHQFQIFSYKFYD